MNFLCPEMPLSGFETAVPGPEWPGHFGIEAALSDSKTFLTDETLKLIQYINSHAIKGEVTTDTVAEYVNQIKSLIRS